MNTLLKKSSIFANILMQKPDNSFTIKNVKKTLEEKKILRKGFTSLRKNSVWDSFQSLLMQIILLVSL